MKLLELRLTRWRNILSCHLTPGPAINVFYGDNAQGKTNLVESIFYLATLRSFRPGRQSQLTAWGSQGFRLNARAQVDQRTVSFEVGLSEGGRRLMVDGAPVDSTDDYFGGFNTVLFTPEHLALVRGEPAGRRSFMDRALFNIDPVHLALVRRYNRVLRERNALLRRGLTAQVDPVLLDALDEQLAAVGATLVVRRLELIDMLSPGLVRFHDLLTGGGKTLALRYHPRMLSEAVAEETPDRDEARWCEVLRRGLAQRRVEDSRRGFTALGPHADDLKMLLDDRPARLVSSQGEARTIVLALKLAEVDWIAERRTEPPVLLLDDMGSELDEHRRSVLFETVSKMQCQTFVTTVDRDWVMLGENNQYFHIVDGQITPDEPRGI